MSASTKFANIKSQYVLSLETLNKIGNGFIDDMKIGLKSDGDSKSCKMLASRVTSIPNGTEKGIFYAIDWGGTNYRVLRMQLYGKNKRPKIDSISYKIASKYKKCLKASELFDYVAILFVNFMKRFNEDKKSINNEYFDVGFTFSFPLKKRKLDEGILIEWNKGFVIDNVIGKDVVKLMNNSFNKFNIPAKIKAICNDTVGALLSCSYYHGIDSKIAVIIGTGTNAAYIEPEYENEIINTEWCYFDGDNKYLPRIQSTDIYMDTYTTNRGEEYTEKMIGGMYIVEIIRLIFIDIFNDKLINIKKSIMFDKFGQFTAIQVGKILNYYFDRNYNGIMNHIILNDKRYGLYDSTFNKNDCKLFGEICELIVNRSADLVATLLLGILQKIKYFKKYNKKYILNDNNKCIIIGIDGSIFFKMPRYQQRLKNTMKRLVGHKIVNNINILHALDGSGIGAALCVAALKRDSTSKL